MMKTLSVDHFSLVLRLSIGICSNDQTTKNGL